MHKLFSFFLSFLTFPVLAAEAEVGSKVGANMDAASMILSLLMVLALIVVSALVLKKFNIQHGATKDLKVISSLHISPREKLVVVQVGEQQLLLGVTAQQINLLERLEKPLEPSKALDTNLTQSLQKLLKRQS